MRTAVLWVEGVLSENDQFDKSQTHVEGIVFCRTLFGSPSDYNLILCSTAPAAVVEHWMRSHGLAQFLVYAAEKLWDRRGIPVSDIIHALTRDNRHDLRLWIDADDVRCMEVWTTYQISTIQPMFSRYARVWDHQPVVSSFAPFDGDLED